MIRTRSPQITKSLTAIASALIVFGVAATVASLSDAAAQQNPALTPELLGGSLLQDFNGNGAVEIIAFGDSITKGEGDFVSPDSDVEDAPEPSREAGYPIRIEGYLGLQVANFGNPGEAFTEGGLGRLINLLSHSQPDIITFFEGSNDARIPASPQRYHRDLQRAINVSRALGVHMVLGTIPPTCCGHTFLSGPLNTYNPIIQTLAAVNDVVLADINHAFANSCGGVANCRLLNRPEGLHPNIAGYDVIGEMMVASLLRIDLLAPDGPTLFAQAVGVPVTAITTIPDPVAITPTQ